MVERRRGDAVRRLSSGTWRCRVCGVTLVSASSSVVAFHCSMGCGHWFQSVDARLVSAGARADTRNCGDCSPREHRGW